MQGAISQFQPWPNASYVAETAAAAVIVGVSKIKLSHASK